MGRLEENIYGSLESNNAPKFLSGPYGARQVAHQLRAGDGEEADWHLMLIARDAMGM